MNKDKSNRHGELVPPSGGKRGVSVRVVIALAVAIVAALGLWWWTSKSTNESPGTPPPIETQTTTAPAAAVAPKADFQKLKGKWLRPDGGYVLKVKSVDDGGRMEASYLNPKLIHVAKAQASQEAGTLKVFIELQDVNYPGSTYDLVYDPQNDSLKGIYYQAALQQQFEVIFKRMQ
jgi:hypothetical protein